MEDRLKRVKELWNETSDSSWYQSLRTDEKIKELLQSPNLAFHLVVYQLIKKYLPLIILALSFWLMEIISFPLLKDAGPMPGQEGYGEVV